MTVPLPHGLSPIKPQLPTRSTVQSSSSSASSAAAQVGVTKPIIVFSSTKPQPNSMPAASLKPALGVKAVEAPVQPIAAACWNKVKRLFRRRFSVIKSSWHKKNSVEKLNRSKNKSERISSCNKKERSSRLRLLLHRTNKSSRKVAPWLL